jgi:hypothetical protein
MKRKGIVDPWEAWGQCAIQSLELARKQGYGMVRVTGLEYPRREHLACLTGGWPEEEGTVIDLTARQFSTKVPARYEVGLSTWLDDACEWLGDSVMCEVYLGMDNWSEPVYREAWVREDIDPDTFVREEAWQKR